MGETGPTVIRGFPLPVVLVAAISRGRWGVPSLDILKRVFYEDPVRLEFYGVDSIRAHSETWRSGYPGPAFQVEYLGLASLEKPPGNLAPGRSLFIGCLGPGMPIALDYRDSMMRPTVVELTIYDNWRVVARDIESLLVALGLDD